MDCKAEGTYEMTNCLHARGSPPISCKWITPPTIDAYPRTRNLDYLPSYYSKVPITLPFFNKKMCIRYIYRHRLCQHLATGTSHMPNRLWWCDAAYERDQYEIMPCTGSDIRLEPESLGRGYCDACIIQGLRLWHDMGLDHDIYAESMGVNLDALMLANPGCLD